MDNENAGRFAVGADPISPHNEKDREKEGRFFIYFLMCEERAWHVCADVTQWETVRNCADNVRNCSDSVRNCADSVRNSAAVCGPFSGGLPGEQRAAYLKSHLTSKTSQHAQYSTALTAAVVRCRLVLVMSLLSFGPGDAAVVVWSW